MNQFSVMNLRENQRILPHASTAVLNFQELTTGEWIRLLKLLYFGLDVGLNLNKILEIPEIYTYSFTGISNSFRKKSNSRYA